MSDLLSNIPAMYALKSLQATSRALEQTQARISTGLKVEAAKDNAAYWSIANTMRNDNASLSTIQDALGIGAAKTDVTYTAMESAIGVVDEIKAKLVAATQSGVDRVKIQAEISELQSQLGTIASAAAFGGENWLSVDSSSPQYMATRNILSSFTRASDGSVEASTIRIDITKTKLFDAADQSGVLDKEFTTTGAVGVSVSVATLDVSIPGLDATDLEDMLQNLDTALLSMTTSASSLGAVKSRIDMQSQFVVNLMGSVERGIGELVDAEMNEESTRLQALQVRQQLGVQALSIANSNAQTILSLFQ